MLYNVSLFISYYHVGICSLYHVLKRLTTAIVTISTGRKRHIKSSEESISLEDIQRFFSKRNQLRIRLIVYQANT